MDADRPFKVLASGEREREKCPRTFTFPADRGRERERQGASGGTEIDRHCGARTK